MHKRIVWTLTVAALLIGVLLLLPNTPNPAKAGVATCRIGCKAKFGKCYIDTDGNRSLCEGRYSACLDQCLKKNNVN